MIFNFAFTSNFTFSFSNWRSLSFFSTYSFWFTKDFSETEEISLKSSLSPLLFWLFDWPFPPFLNLLSKLRLIDFSLSISILNSSLERGLIRSGPLVRAFTTSSSHISRPFSFPSLSYVYFLRTSITMSWSAISLFSCSISLLLLCYFDCPSKEAFSFLSICIELRRFLTLSECILVRAMDGWKSTFYLGVGFGFDCLILLELFIFPGELMLKRGDFKSELFDGLSFCHSEIFARKQSIQLQSSSLNINKEQHFANIIKNMT